MATDNVHEAAVSKRNFPRRSKAMKKVMKKIYLRSYYVKEYKKIENSWNN